MDINMTPRVYKYSLPILLASIAVFTAGCAGTPPPKAQLAVSKVAVANATSAGSNEFAPLEIKAAVEKLTQAEKAMVEEEYERARYLAEQAQVDATLAEAKTRAAKSQQTVEASQEAIRVLREELSRNKTVAQ